MLFPSIAPSALKGTIDEAKTMSAHLLRNGAEIFAAYVVTACRGCRASSRPLRPKGHVSFGAANS